MATVTREELRGMIDAIPEDLLSAAQEALRRLLLEQEKDPRRAKYHRRLIESGLVRRIPSTPTEDEIRQFREWKPIKIEGKPVSETLIEERR